MTQDLRAIRGEMDRAIEGMTLCTAFADTAEKCAEVDALRWRAPDGTWHGMSWRQYRERVRDLTLALREMASAGSASRSS